MKQFAIICSLLIVLLPSVLAETKIFSGAVITGRDTVINGMTFRFQYDDASNQVFVQTPTKSIIVKNGDCGIGGVFKVCINSANFSDKNVTTYEYYYQIDTTIYTLTGSLSVNSSSSSGQLLQGELGKVTITVTNPTDFDITDINFSYVLSPFSIQDATGCVSDGSHLKWKGSLKSKYDEICTAAVISKSEGTYYLSGTVNYYNGFESLSDKTIPLEMTVLPKQLQISTILDDNIEVKQPFYFNVSLENIHDSENLQAFVTIVLPPSFKVLKKLDDFTRDTNMLKHSSVFKPGEIKNFSFYLQASSETETPLRQIFSYVIKGISDVIENDTYVKVLESKPITDFYIDYPEVNPGQKFTVLVRINNPSRIYELDSIQAILDAPYNREISQYLNRIMPNETYFIISNILIAPPNEDLGRGITSKSIRLNLSISYEIDGAVISFNKTLDIPIKQNLSNSVTVNTTSRTFLQISNNTELAKTFASKTSTGNETGKKSMSVGEYMNSINPKRRFFYAVIVIVAVVLPLFIAYKVGKKRHEKGQFGQDAIKELEEKL